MCRDNIELAEVKHPMLFKTARLMPGTGGSGRHRGGSVNGSTGTINNHIVNDDVIVTVSIDKDAGQGRYRILENLGPLNPYQSSYQFRVRNGADDYVLGVRLPDPKHVSGTLAEGDTINLQFMRCVGTANTEIVKSCADAVTPRAGARPPPALTQSITVEGRGNFFEGTLPNSVPFADGSFSKTVEIETDDDAIDENDGGLIVRTFANSTSQNRYVSVTLSDDDLTKISIAPVSASVTEGTDAVFTITRSDTELLPEDSVGVGLTFHAKMFDSTTLPSTGNNLTLAAGATEVRLTVPTHDDQLNEGDGMVRADLSGVGSYQTVPGSTWIRIVDDDVPTVTLSVDTTSITEGEPIEWSMARSGFISDILRLSTEREFVKYYPDQSGPPISRRCHTGHCSNH